MTVVRAAIVLAGCSGRSQPAPAEHTTVPVAARDAAVIDAGALVDETAPATRTFDARPGRSLAGHTRASWPLDLPEMPWVANTFVNMSLDGYDGAHVSGTVELYAAPGLAARQCTVEVVWDAPGKRGVQLRAAPAIVPVDDRIGTRATWRFRAPVPNAPPAVKASAYVFCPNDVMFYSIEMIAPGPGMRDAYCKDLRRDPTRLADGSPVGAKSFDLAFACGALIRLRGRELVDECRGDTLLTLDALGTGTTTTAPVAGTPITDEELRRLYGGGAECARIEIAAPTTFPTSAKQPFAAFAKRAGERLVGTYTTIDNIQP